MRKITFTVSSPKDGAEFAMLDVISSVSCRIQINSRHGLITAEDIPTKELSILRNTIKQYYTIERIDIDNLPPEDIYAPVVKTVPTDSSQPPSTENIISQTKYPQISEAIEKLSNSVLWKMDHRDIPEKEIVNYLYSWIAELSLRYDSKPSLAVSPGDIVECNLGYHLPGEIYGSRIQGLVGGTIENLVYIVPLINASVDDVKTSKYPYKLDTAKDVIYSERQSEDFQCVALLDRGRYVRIERVNEVLGKTSVDFFEKHLANLHSTPNFLPLCQTNKTVPYSSVNSTKIGNQQSALEECIGPALERIVPSSTGPSRQLIEQFLLDIKFDSSDFYVLTAFQYSVAVQQITYSSICAQISSNPVHAEKILKKEFNKWISQYPELKQTYPKISFCSLLKAFAKRFK